MHVVAGPGLDYLAGLVAVDVDAGDGGVLAGGRDAHQLTAVGAGRGPAGDDLVSLCDLIVDRDLDVGKRPPVDLDELRQAFGPDELSTRYGGVVKGRIGGDQLIDDREVALVPDFLKRPARKRLVLIGHGSTPCLRVRMLAFSAKRSCWLLPRKE